MHFGSKPLVLKNPQGPARVIIIGRISTPHQNIENIDASYRYVEEYLKSICQGPMETLHLGERASGMRTDRESIMRAEEEIATGTWDLVIAEDLSRIYRNPRFQYEFVQEARDKGTRVICIGDNLDTEDENWEVTMGAAALRHGLYVPDTRRRVRRTATDSFHKGGMVLKVRFGYRKLTKEEARSGQFGRVDLRIVKVPDCTAVIQKMRAMVLAGQSYPAVADWLNLENVQTGRYVTSEQWSGKLVKEFLRDPILHGTRTFRDMVYDPIFGTGKHRRSKNAQAPESETHPELAHLTPEEHAELLEEMDRRAREHFEPKEGTHHPLYNRPRSRTLWPGQHMRCAICGGLYYWGCDGQLKCENSFERGLKHCWNHVQVSAEQARVIVVRWLLSRLERHPGFREEFVDAAWNEYVRTMHASTTKGRNLDEQIRDLEKQAGKLAKAIRFTDGIDVLVRELSDVNQSLTKARRQQRAEQTRASENIVLDSQTAFAARLDEGIISLSRSSYDFADLMRRVIPEFVICPVQALDTGLVRPRARITLRLSSSSHAEDAQTDSMDSDLKATLDLFSYPVYIQVLRACLAEKEQDPKITLIAIATKLRIPYVTVKRAFKYHRQMQQEGLDDPYRELRAKPAKASRWRKRAAPYCDEQVDPPT